MAISKIVTNSITDAAVTSGKLGTVYTANISGLGALATVDNVASANVTGLGALAAVDNITTANVTNIGTIATQDSDNVTITGGAITVTSQKETKIDMSTDAIDLSLGNYFTKNCTATVTFTVSNVPSANTVGAFVLDLTNGGDQTVNWFSNVVWNGGTAPTLTSGGRDCLAFFTHDAGTTWNGFILGQAMAAAA